MNDLIDRFKIDITAPLKRMSKGMKQKMGIVARIYGAADIYLLDEPSTGLDPADEGYADRADSGTKGSGEDNLPFQPYLQRAGGYL